jgi:phosphopantetheinyl transferase (holo-ACP synthase)
MNSQIETFTSFIKEQLEDDDLHIFVKPEWSSENANHRIKIREHLAKVDSSYFTRQQLAELYDLNQRPRAAEGFVSISHCPRAGGYSFSKYKHGFDIEDIRRITDPIILRTSTEDEQKTVPHLKFLWVAKEAAFKALSDSVSQEQKLVVTDLICKNWLQTTALDIWSFQIKSEKNFSFEQNIGFVFSSPELLFAIYFK